MSNLAEKFLEDRTFHCVIYSAKISEQQCSYLRCRDSRECFHPCKGCSLYKRPRKKELTRYKSKALSRTRVGLLCGNLKVQKLTKATTNRNAGRGSGSKDYSIL